MTKPPIILRLCVLLCAIALSRAASAAVCVQIDASRDALTERDRNSARVFFAQALQHEGLQVAERDCSATYSVYHLTLGNSVTVFMQGPQGYRQATANGLEEIPAVYSQMVRSLLSGQPMNTVNGTVDRTNATMAQQAPNRVEADSLWYLRLGYAGALGPNVNSGPAIGFGYRYELDSIGVDVSFLNFMFADNTRTNSTTGTSGSASASGSWAKLMCLYFLNPLSNGSTYLGAGLSWGATAVVTDSTAYSGSGLQGEISAGFELLRASTIRLFVEADATLPFYKVHGLDFNTGNDATSYTPLFSLSLGVGWGHPAVRVRVIN